MPSGWGATAIRARSGSSRGGCPRSSRSGCDGLEHVRRSRRPQRPHPPGARARLDVRAHGPRALDHLRHPRHREFRPWRALHDRQLCHVLRHRGARTALPRGRRRRGRGGVRRRSPHRARPRRAAAQARRPRMADGRLRAHHRPHGDPAARSPDPLQRRAPRRGAAHPRRPLLRRDRRQLRAPRHPGHRRPRRRPALGLRQVHAHRQGDPRHRPERRGGADPRHRRQPHLHCRLRHRRGPRRHVGGAPHLDLSRLSHRRRRSRAQELRRRHHRWARQRLWRHRRGTPSRRDRGLYLLPDVGGMAERAHRRPRRRHHDREAERALRPQGSAAMRRPAAPAEGLTPLRLAKLALLAFFLLCLPARLDIPYVTSIYISALMFGIFGAIYDLMIGYAGLSNFGFAGFLAVGAYTSALGAVHDGISPWLGLLLGGLAAALVGLVTGVITLRLRGLYLGLITWFVGDGIDFSRGGDALAYYYLLIVLGAAIMAAMHLLVRSRIGLAFKAIREDQLATESLGLSATKYKLINFVVAMFFTGVMGAFYAHYLGILTPTPEEFGVPRTVEILTLAYVGGRGTLWGSLFAAFLLIGFQEYFRGLGAYRLVLFGVLLILVMLFARKGLAGLKKFVW